MRGLGLDFSASFRVVLCGLRLFHLRASCPLGCVSRVLLYVQGIVVFIRLGLVMGAFSLVRRTCHSLRGFRPTPPRSGVASFSIPLVSAAVCKGIIVSFISSPITNPVELMYGRAMYSISWDSFASVMCPIIKRTPCPSTECIFP